MSARVDSQINFSVVVHGRMQDLPRGAAIIYTIIFGGWGLATRGYATRLLGGFGGMLRRKKNVMVQFGAFWSIFS